jgi:hypothetical protein
LLGARATWKIRDAKKKRFELTILLTIAQLIFGTAFIILLANIIYHKHDLPLSFKIVATTGWAIYAIGCWIMYLAFQYDEDPGKVKNKINEILNKFK